MASEIVGSVGTVGGYVTEVQRNPGGTVTLFSAREATYSASQLARLRELLDRAAAPRRPAGEAILPGESPALVGELFDAHGDPMEVRLWPRGAIEVRDRLADATRLALDAGAARDLAQLLDRAAMPGQPAQAAGPAAADIARCDESEDPYHRCPNCWDYAAGRSRPVRLTDARGGGEAR